MTPAGANRKLSLAWMLYAENPPEDAIFAFELIDFDWQPTDADRAHARKLAQEHGLL